MKGKDLLDTSQISFMFTRSLFEKTQYRKAALDARESFRGAMWIEKWMARAQKERIREVQDKEYRKRAKVDRRAALLTELSKAGKSLDEIRTLFELLDSVEKVVDDVNAPSGSSASSQLVVVSQYQWDTAIPPVSSQIPVLRQEVVEETFPTEAAENMAHFAAVTALVVNGGRVATRGAFQNVLVPEASARYGEPFMTVNADHNSLSKPTDKTSVVYKQLKSLIQASSSDSKKKVLGGVVACVVLVAALALYLVYYKQQRLKRKEKFFDVPADDDPEMVPLGQLRKFSFWELQIATDNFSSKNIVGQGGFGKVYKGCLSDVTTVAVKRLKEDHSPEGEHAVQTEVEMISNAVHRNLLRLQGFCTTPSERILVYPYMPNGSVASHLRASTTRGAFS
ncbi:hypothetical protein R1flu_008136 [Riccia fluitans]|uniref:Protein kinase domain-containing protein n=1 Tax=Riccia fluitans TaxID=41844 RepID=A0ABD1YAW8_9MARC